MTAYSKRLFDPATTLGEPWGSVAASLAHAHERLDEIDDPAELVAIAGRAARICNEATLYRAEALARLATLHDGASA